MPANRIGFGATTTTSNDLPVWADLNLPAGTKAVVITLFPTNSTNSPGTPTLGGAAFGASVAFGGTSTVRGLMCAWAGDFSGITRVQTTMGFYGECKVVWEAYDSDEPVGTRLGATFANPTPPGTLAVNSAPTTGSQTCPPGGALSAVVAHAYSALNLTASAGTLGAVNDNAGSQRFATATRSSTGAFTWSANDAAISATAGIVINGAGASNPVLSSPSGTPTGNTTATVGFTTDTAVSGALPAYFLTLPAATAAPADAATLIANGATVSQTTGGTTPTRALTGLTTNTAVRTHMCQPGSNVVSTASYTPPTMASSGSLPAQSGTAGATFTYSGATPESQITQQGVGASAWTLTNAGGSGLTTINSSTGVPGGTLTSTPGVYTVTVTKTDSSTAGTNPTGGGAPPQTIVRTISLTVNAVGGGVTFSGTVPGKNGTVGVAFAFGTPTMDSYFTGSGTYALQSGTLPPGLTINATTGAPEGTPSAAGTYPGIVVRKTATSGSPATADSNAFSITIAAAPVLAGFDLDTAAGCRIGNISGSLVGLGAVSAGLQIVVHAKTPGTDTTVASSGTLTTNSSGRLPRWTHASLTVGNTYDLFFAQVNGGPPAVRRMVAT